MSVVVGRRFGTVCRSHLQESCLTLEDRTDKLSQNAAEQLPIYAMQHPAVAKASTTLWQKPGISHVLCHFLPLIQSTYRRGGRVGYNYTTNGLK